ncbi:MAG TPA: FkbM family methyltransferase [Wenzhouxiangella sp.]
MSPLFTLIDQGLDRFARLTYQPYHRALAALLHKKGQLRIAVVGANDGKINDPVYGFVQQHPDQTEMILVEPQVDLLAPLAANYAHHPEAHIIHGAVGPQSVIKLYTVDPTIWSKTQPFYAKAWPAYRAPSGIVSSERDRVLAWIGGYVKRPETHVVETEVEARPLTDWLSAKGLPETIDVLQVDTEGVDDQVIYHSALEITQPAVIYFESKNLSTQKLNDLRAHLSNLGYQMRRILGNTLAVR